MSWTSPRGRIYLIKDMLEAGRPATAEVVRHLDRCLSCLACMTTCPSGVNYMHLIDNARIHIEETYRRPLLDRLIRSLIASVLPEPRYFRPAATVAGLFRPLAPVFRRIPGFGPVAAMLDFAPAALPRAAPEAETGLHPAPGTAKLRVGLLAGCVQKVIAPQINAATVRVLNRLGADVIIPGDLGCCGALTHHLGHEADAMRRARATLAVWTRENEIHPLEAIIANASGCGTMLKNYGHLFRNNANAKAAAELVESLSIDISEILVKLGYFGKAPRPLRVAYQSACSLQHGQKVTRQPVALLAAAGFQVMEVPEGHLCCGSAGTYNLLQPVIASALRNRKLENIMDLKPDVIASGNIGCITQLASASSVPVLHTVELLDWAAGGPIPAALNAPQQSRGNR